MTVNENIAEADLLRFSEVVERQLGLDFDEGQLSELGVIARDRMRELGCADIGEYLHLLQAAGSVQDEEFRALASRLTTGETYFFRNPEQFEALTEIAVPDLTRDDPARPIRILSAGCATGEEPFTLAMTILERDATAQASILGIDLNPRAIAKARRGRYSAWSMRATTPANLAMHFRRERGEFVVADRVRAMVRFEERNLAKRDPHFWRSDSFEVIFCRNVVMYLSPRVLREVIARFARVLTADGFLFLSHVEPLRGISQAFQVEHGNGSFYYRLRAADGTRRAKWAESDPAVREQCASAIMPKQSNDMLAASIQAASNRIAKLTDAPTSGAQLPAATPDPVLQARIALETETEQHSRVSVATALIRAERFDEALALLEALSPEERSDPDVLFLMATILMDRGRLERASELCVALLALDDLNAAAHYLLALCHEQSGRRQAAVDSYRVGVYLDRTFAMPHLRLGLMFRREGDLPGARRELENASILLAREDPARVLLFGGGFSRRTLLNLCDSERRLCGGSR